MNYNSADHFYKVRMDGGHGNSNDSMEQLRDKPGDLQIIFLLLKACHCPQNSA